jgi:hypothetical protein
MDRSPWDAFWGLGNFGGPPRGAEHRYANLGIRVRRAGEVLQDGVDEHGPVCPILLRARPPVQRRLQSAGVAEAFRDLLLGRQFLLLPERGPGTNKTPTPLMPRESWQHMGRSPRHKGTPAHNNLGLAVG